MISETHCILYTPEGHVNINELMLKEQELFPLSYTLTVDKYKSQTLPDQYPVYVTVSHCVTPCEFTVYYIVQ